MTLLATVLGIMIAGAPGAQAIDQQWEWCLGPDPSMKIPGCSAVIQSRETPENLATAYNGRGNAYLGVGRFDRAIQDFTQAARLNPEDAGGFNNRGLAYARTGQYDSAIKDFDQAIRINPAYARAFQNRGLALQAQGHRDLAAADFAKASQLSAFLPARPVE